MRASVTLRISVDPRALGLALALLRTTDLLYTKKIYSRADPALNTLI